MSKIPSAAERNRTEYDPVFLHSRKEAIVIFFVWLAGLIWAVPFCYITGYSADLDPKTFQTVLGIPRWLFWGIFVPWIVADVFTMWFCFCFMAEDDLGESGDSDAPRVNDIAGQGDAETPSEDGGLADE